MKKFLAYLMRSRLHACLAAVIASLLPLFGWVSIVMVSLVTLRRGMREGLFVLIAASLPNLLLALTRDEMSIWFSAKLFIISCILAWLSAVILRASQSWRLTIDVMVLMFVAFYAAVYLLFPQVEQWWISHLLDYLQQVAATSPDGHLLSDEKIQALSYTMGSNVMWSINASMLLFSLLHLGIARWAQAVLYNPGAFRTEIHGLRLGRLLFIMMGVAALLSLLGMPHVGGALVLFAIAFIGAGACLVHYWVAATGRGTAWLIVLYIGLCVPFASVAVLSILGMLGTIDSLVDLRSRISVTVEKTKGSD